MVDGLYKTLFVKEAREEVPGFKTFVFEDGHNIEYRPGQYLTLVRFFNNEEVRRSYSIISTPVLNESLSIGVKRVENGFFSRVLVDHIHAGSELTTSGVGGFFVLPADVSGYSSYIFFAAGSGISPVFSLIRTLLFAHPVTRVRLVYSNASPSKTIFLEALRELEMQFSGRFEVVFFFSNYPDLSKARLHRDAIFHLLDRFTDNEFSKAVFYICGPESYMRLCTYTLQEAGVNPLQIRKENFIIDKIRTPKAAPPDKEEHVVNIRFAGKEYSFNMAYPDTILSAAKRSGIHLPYSCETGRCGNCVSICKKGKVWHSYNEVLTEKDLESGLILPCVGYPVHGDVDIEYPKP
jgi:ferredoxin-NADP reductase